MDWFNYPKHSLWCFMTVNSRTMQMARKTPYMATRLSPYSLPAWNLRSGSTVKENPRLMQRPADSTRVILVHSAAHREGVNTNSNQYRG